MQKIDKDLIPIDLYKDPLKENEGGFGYLGCILQTREEDKLQCHICGQMFASLSPHIRGKHKISSPEYREKFKLARQTSLMSRAHREKLINGYLSMPKEVRDAARKKGMENSLKLKSQAVSQKGYKQSLETKNKRGSCPDQILQEIKRVAEELGHTPSQLEFTKAYPMGYRYFKLASRTFGSWNRAVEIAGFKKNTSGRKLGVKWRPPWEPEVLKELLLNFAKEHNRIPRYSDLIRGELPPISSYVRKFGSLEKARVASGVYDFF